MAKQEKPVRLFSSDRFMKTLWSTMVRDFRSNLGSDFLIHEESLMRNSMAQYRAHEWNRGYLSMPYYFKAKYQMESLFKRYIFESDAFTQDQLDEQLKKKFIETQMRLPMCVPGKQRVHLVLQEARKICRSILGTYDLEEHVRACRFGRRASVGNPASQSYLDAKMGSPLSGSPDHLAWFKRILEDDLLLKDALAACTPFEYPRDMPCDTLTLTSVPKSFKSLRGIMPNTTVGSFYSYGLGKVIQKRLVGVGLNIRYLQSKHRRLAQFFSKTRSHVTADLSSASDSITSWLCNRIIPREWFRALNFGRIKNFQFRGETQTYSLHSFCTMGIGFTFQLQTLLFYCLLKAIKECACVPGIVSVYGDDLIYPTAMHNFVRQIFSDLGFILNLDKTFVKTEFRESCGGDYYCGFDVRPFQPEGQSSHLTGKSYLALLYKTFNGLQRRWSGDLTQTYRWLHLEILRVSDTIFQVPLDFPDYSGIQVEFPSRDYLLNYARITHNRNGTAIFPYLKFTYQDRAVVWQFPFYWESLRCRADDSDSWNPFSQRADEPNIRWVKVDSKPWRSSVTRRRYQYRLRAVVVKKASKPAIARQTGSTFQWS